MNHFFVLILWQMPWPLKLQVFENHFGIMNHSTIIQYKCRDLSEWVEALYLTARLPWIVNDDLMRNLLLKQGNASFSGKWARRCNKQFHNE